MAKDGLIRWTTVTLDCSDAEDLAAFYSDLLGWEKVLVDHLEGAVDRCSGPAVHRRRTSRLIVTQQGSE